jgi:hypothetical protein
MMTKRTKRQGTYWAIGAIAAAGVLAAAVATSGNRMPTTRPLEVLPADLPQQPAELIGYYHSIALTPAQEAIKQEALAAIPAPCCSSSSIATCCCPCNLAKSVWGLAHFLIAKRGYSAPQVRATVEGWLVASNPRGYSGKACFNRGCGRPFDHDGCGGMDEAQVS